MVMLTELMRFGYLGIKPLIKEGKMCQTPKGFCIHMPKQMAVINKKPNSPLYIFIVYYHLSKSI